MQGACSGVIGLTARMQTEGQIGEQTRKDREGADEETGEGRRSVKENQLASRITLIEK